MVRIAVFRLLLALVAAASVLASAAAADRAAREEPAAGTASPSPSLETLSAEQARALIARLSDTEVRELLLRQLDARAQPAPAAPGPDTLALIVDYAQTMRYRLGAMIAALPDVPYAALFVVDRLTDDRDPTRIVTLMGGLAIVLGVAALAEWGVHRPLRAAGGLRRPEASADPLRKLAILCGRALIDFLALVVFALAGVLAFFVVHPDQDLEREAFWCVFLGILGTRVAAIVFRMLLSPGRADLRLPDLADERARGFYRSLVGFAALTAAVVAFGVIAVSVGLPEPLTVAIGTIIQWANLGALIALIWLRRRDIDRLVGSHQTASEQTAGEQGGIFAGRQHVLLTWAVVALGLFAMVSRFLTGEGQASRILPTLALLIVWLPVDGLMRMIVRRVVPPPEPQPPGTLPREADDRDGGSAAPADYAPVIIRNVRIVVVVLVLLVLGRIWGIELKDFVSAGLANRIGESLFQIVLTLVVASAVWGVIKTAISRHAPQDEFDTNALIEGEGAGTGLSRLQTLLPLVRKFLFIVLVAIVGMIVISSLGIDIGPLLAGAGVVGIAIGFGAQALVRDIFSGIFFLVDDAFRIGEYIDVGGAKGVVERISIRSLRLRHHLGQINTIPFGEIKHVTNFSRDWAIMKLELQVPLDTDLEKVRKLVKQVGQDMLGDPELARNILQPLKSQGVNRMEPSAYVVRVKFMARPGEQFVVRREVFRRLHECFRANGIRLGVSPVVVDGAQGTAGAAGAIAMAPPVATTADPAAGRAGP